VDAVFFLKGLIILVATKSGRMQFLSLLNIIELHLGSSAAGHHPVLCLEMHNETGGMSRDVCTVFSC
jgi:hypothetical protein